MELKTVIYNRHIQNKAKMINFFGWLLPLDYGSVLEEAKAVRKTVGIFDISHMGKIKIEGRHSLEFLQKLTTNDVSILKKGQLQYNLFVNEIGGIIDDFVLYNLGDAFLCLVNCSNIEKDFNWLLQNRKNMIEKYNFDIEIVSGSLDVSFFSLQGPNAHLIMEKIFGKDVSNLVYMHFTEKTFNSKKIIISRSGYTAEDGFEIYCPNDTALYLWDLILDIGKNFEIALCGLGARDILRIEAGYPLYGQDIDENTNPYKASLDWVVKLNKDFIAKEELLKIKDNLKCKRVGFLMKDRALARKSCKIFSSDKLVGEVSSGTYSPNLDKFIGMAYVDINFAKFDTPIEIRIRDKFYLAKIVSFSFIQKKYK